jgi:hypothetical protein
VATLGLDELVFGLIEASSCGFGDLLVFLRAGGALLRHEQRPVLLSGHP